MKNVILGRVVARHAWLGAVASVFLGLGSTYAQTAVDWSNPSGGLWGDALNWSTGLVPINGLPAVGDRYDVRLGFLPTPYVVQMDMVSTVDSVVIASPLAELQLIDGGQLTATSGIDVNYGSFTLAGGSLVDTRVYDSSGSGLFQLVRSTSGVVLDGVTLASDLAVQVDSLATIRNGLTLESSNIAAKGNASWTFDGNQLIDGSGLIQVGSTSLAPQFTLRADDGLTFGQDIRINVAKGNFSLLTYGMDENQIVNNGVISIASGARVGGTAYMEEYSPVYGNHAFVNNGTVDVRGVLALYMDSQNNGVYRLHDSGMIDLNGNYSAEDVGTVVRDQPDSGRLRLLGAMLPTDGLVELKSEWGAIEFEGFGVGNTIVSSGAGLVEIGGTATGSTLQGEFDVRTTLYVEDGLTLEGATLRGDDSIGIVTSRSNDVVIAGNGTLTGHLAVIGDAVQIGPGIHVQADSGSWVQLGAFGGSTLDVADFQGTALVDGEDSGLSFTGRWANHGQVTVLGGTVKLGGYFDLDDLYAMDIQGGTVNLTPDDGSYGGETLAFGSEGVTWRLNGKMSDVFFEHSGSDDVVVDNLSVYNATLRGTSVYETHSLAGYGLSLDGTTISLDARRDSQYGYDAANLRLDSSGVVGNGTIRFDNPITPGLIYGLDFPEPAYVGPGIVIRTGEGDGLLRVVNNGTIVIDDPDRFIQMEGDWSNQGVIDIAAGQLRLGGTFTSPDVGTINHTGGRLFLNGELDLEAGVVDVGAWGGPVILGHEATIRNGTLQYSQGAFETSSALKHSTAMTFDGVSLDADVHIGDGSTLVLNGTNHILAGRVLSVGGTDIDGIENWPASVGLNQDSQLLGGEVHIAGDNVHFGFAGDADDNVSVDGTVYMNNGYRAVFDAQAQSNRLYWRFDGTSITEGEGGQSEFRDYLTLDGSGQVIARNGGVARLQLNQFMLGGGALIEAAEGGTVYLNGIDNLGREDLGRIKLSGGDLRLIAGASLGELDVIDYESGRIIYDGIRVSMAGQTLNLDEHGPITLDSALFTEGMIVGSAGKRLIISEESYLEGVTVQADVEVQDDLYFRRYADIVEAPASSAINSRFFAGAEGAPSGRLVLGELATIQDIQSEVDILADAGVNTVNIAGTLNLSNGANFRPGKAGQVMQLSDVVISGGGIVADQFESIDIESQGYSMTADHLSVASGGRLTSTTAANLVLLDGITNTGGKMELAADRLFLLGDANLVGGDTMLSGDTSMAISGSVNLSEGADVVFAGEYHSSRINAAQRLDASDIRVIAAGRIDNQGSTLSLDDSTGDVWVTGNFNGGRIESAGDQIVRVGYVNLSNFYTGYIPIFDGVTLASDLEAQTSGNPGYGAKFINGLTLDDATLRNDRQTFTFDGNQRVDGQGKFVLSGMYAYINARDGMTIGDGVSIELEQDTRAFIEVSDLEGQVNLDGLQRHLTFEDFEDNRGTINIQNGAVALIEGGTWTNSGLINVDDAALELEAFVGTDIQGDGTLNLSNGGRVYHSGHWYLGGGTVSSEAFGGDWALSGGFIRDGTVDMVGEELEATYYPEFYYGNEKIISRGTAPTYRYSGIRGATVYADLHVLSGASFAVTADAYLESAYWHLDPGSKMAHYIESLDDLEVTIDDAVIENLATATTFGLNSSVQVSGTSVFRGNDIVVAGELGMDGHTLVDVASLTFNPGSTVEAAGVMQSVSFNSIGWNNQSRLIVKDGQELELGRINGSLGEVVISDGLAVGGTFDVDRSIHVGQDQFLALFENWSASVAPTVAGGAVGIDDQPLSGQAKTVQHADSLIASWSVSDATALVVFDTTLSDVLGLDTNRYAGASIYGGILRTATLDLEGQQLDIDQSPLDWSLAGGRLTNGTVTASLGGSLKLTRGEAARFNEMTLMADVDAGEGRFLFYNTDIDGAQLSTRSVATDAIEIIGDFWINNVAFGSHVTLTEDNAASSVFQGDIDLNGDLSSPRSLSFQGNTSFNGQGTIYSGNRTWSLNGSSLVIGSGITLDWSGSQTVDGFTSDFINNGTVLINRGANVTVHVGHFENHGLIELDDATLKFVDYQFINGADGVIAGTGSLDVASRTFINDGYIAPGFSPGILGINGSFTQDTSGHLQIEIAGTGGVAGRDFDQLQVTGAVDLSGVLEVSVLGTPVFNSNTTFTILVTQTEEIVGTFDKVVVKQDAVFDVTYGTNAVTISGNWLGDMDDNGVVDLNDVLGFVLAMTDPASYSALYGIDGQRVGDMTGDGSFNFDDITPFADRLNLDKATRQALFAAVPEPSTFAVVMLGSTMLFSRRSNPTRRMSA